MLGLAGVVFLLLRFISAPYGRHARRGWGPALPCSWGWVVMESPAVWIFAGCYALAPGSLSTVQLVFLGLWLAHYLHRALIYPLRLRGRGNPIVLSVVLMGFIFNIFNAFLNGHWLAALAPPYATAWLGDPRFIAGLLLFLAGMILNIHSDSVLLNLRRGSKGQYQIPRGGAFQWITCPNYLGEIVEWMGWALLTWSLPGMTFAVWTAANLAPRALTHHRWYHEHFEDYPKARKALIPFVL